MRTDSVADESVKDYLNWVILIMVRLL